MLAYANCRYFEQPAPYPAFEYGAHDVIRPDAQGYVRVPDAPGPRHRHRLAGDRGRDHPPPRAQDLKR